MTIQIIRGKNFRNEKMHFLVAKKKQDQINPGN